MNFEVGKVIETKIFDSIPEFLEFVKRMESFEHEIEVEKAKIARTEVEGKEWYLDVLNGKRVVGVDGSQLRHLREFGIPFGAVQVVRFSVVHGAKEYSLKFKSKWVGLEHDLDLERFNLEIDALIEEMGKGDSHLFYDGSFVLSFISQLRKDLKEAYTESINRMLEKSEETSTPVFGFVEKSFARDISDFIYDALALRDILNLFEYTKPLPCKREITKEYRERVYFSYLSLNRLFPIRIEFPEWMVDEIDRFAELVAAECLLGSTRNYPYVLERAHKYAVVREVEREAIGRMFSKVATAGTSFKWVSKKM